MSDTGLKNTPLHELHLALGARMISFAGYAMPVQYRLGVKGEHLHTRSGAGLFDISHMGQLRVDGKSNVVPFESLVTGDISALRTGAMRYTMFTGPDGGILDDLIVAKADDHLSVVVNAARRESDTSLMIAAMGDAVTRVENALLALQGPSAARIMRGLAPGSEDMLFMTSASLDLAGVGCFVTRSGYTGEDGFEISVPVDHAEEVAMRLLADPDVAPIGLGARDSLRLEAGLCLYGHDIDETTTPVEADLLWAVSKSRRARGDFPGSERILDQINRGVARIRVGLRPEGRALIREGTELVDSVGDVVGKVTSGGYGPNVEGPVAMGYVKSEFAAPKTRIEAIVRGRALPVRIVQLPFVPARYYRGQGRGKR